MNVNENTRLIVLDFETLGTNIKECPVMSLGIVIGDTMGNIAGKKEFIFPLAEQLNKTWNNHIDKDTLAFWNKAENKKQFDLYLSKCFQTVSSMQSVVATINNLITAYLVDDNYLFVGNAPEFDLTLLEKLYEDYTDNLKIPFNYQQKFDFRSARYLLEMQGNIPDKRTNLNPHNGLADAEWEYFSLVGYIN